MSQVKIEYLTGYISGIADELYQENDQLNVQWKDSYSKGNELPVSKEFIVRDTTAHNLSSGKNDDFPHKVVVNRVSCEMAKQNKQSGEK